MSREKIDDEMIAAVFGTGNGQRVLEIIKRDYPDAGAGLLARIRRANAEWLTHLNALTGLDKLDD